LARTARCPLLALGGHHTVGSIDEGKGISAPAYPINLADAADGSTASGFDAAAARYHDTRSRHDARPSPGLRDTWRA